MQYGLKSTIRGATTLQGPEAHHDIKKKSGSKSSQLEFTKQDQTKCLKTKNLNCSGFSIDKA